MNAPVNAVHSPISLNTSVGYLVAWQFSRPGYNEGEFTAPRTEVRALFERFGFAGCVNPKRADPVDALVTAARRGERGKGIMVEPLVHKNKDAKMVMGVYYQVPTKLEVGDEWVLGARVRVETDKCVARAPEEPNLSTDAVHVTGRTRAMQVAEDIAKRANLLMECTQNTELSESILTAGRACFWASFRKAGGVYWVPASSRAQNFRDLLLALEQFGHFWPTVQPLFGDAEGLTLRNVSAAAEAAVLGEIEDLTKELAIAEGGKAMREKTVAARRTRCQELVLQAECYRAVLASKVDQFATTLNAVHARFGKLLGEVGDDSAFAGIE